METRIQITLSNGKQHSFIRPLKKEKNIDELNQRDDFPDWVRLDFHQCAKCPLKKEKVKWCPAAAKIVDVVNAFPELTSYDMVTFKMKWENSEYTERLSAQDALVQILLNMMVVSACPEMHADLWSWEYYNPRYNLKSALFRRLSNQLICQYISKVKRKEYSTHMTKEETLLRIIEKLKHRIDHAATLKEDAVQNALVVLHGLISMMDDGYMDYIIDELASHFKEKTQNIQVQYNVLKGN